MTADRTDSKGTDRGGTERRGSVKVRDSWRYWKGDGAERDTKEGDRQERELKGEGV